MFTYELWVRALIKDSIAFLLFQILCVRSGAERSLDWVSTSKYACAAKDALIIDREFMIGRAAHDSENGVFVAAGLRQGEALTTAFKTVRTHDVYEVLVERQPVS